MSKQNISPQFSEADEFRQVKKDLYFVLVLNAIFLVSLIGLFFWNRSTGSMDSWFAKIFNF
jgi:hypothetical protein